MSAQRKPADHDGALPFVLLPIERVIGATGMGRSKIAELLDPKSPRYDKAFPRPRQVGARSIAWRSDELAAWMAALPVVGAGTEDA